MQALETEHNADRTHPVEEEEGLLGEGALPAERLNTESLGNVAVFQMYESVLLFTCLVIFINVLYLQVCACGFLNSC